MKHTQLFLAGTYTEPVLAGTGEIFPGRGEGIYFLELDREKRKLTVTGVERGIPNPSFLAVAQNQKHVYCVNELKEFQGGFGGSISFLELDRQQKRLQLKQSLPTHGTDPCHVAVAAKQVFAANYSSGSTCVYVRDGDGFLTETDFDQYEGKGLNPLRQEGPHAHSCILTDRQMEVIVIDLGTDRLHGYRFTEDGRLERAPELSYEDKGGSGPRFAVWDQDGTYLYVIHELSCTVSVLKREKDGFSLMQEISTLPEGTELVPEYTCADLHFSPDGRFLYASTRGHNSLTVFAVSKESGTLEMVQNLSSGGKTPRNFALDESGLFLLAANQDSDNVILFERDPESGRLTSISGADVPAAVCLCSC